MTGSILNVSTLVIGGGILGVTYCAKAAMDSSTDTILCVRLSDTERPNCESIRNQGIFQSGIRYAGQDFALAEAMNSSGNELHLTALIGNDAHRGLTQMLPEQEEEFLSTITGTFFETMIQKISADEARKLSPPFCEDGLAHYLMPERHLAIPAIMESYRALARRHGVHFRTVSGAHLEHSHSPGRACVRIDDTLVYAETLVITAGVGNLAFLDQLKPGNPWQVQRTPLLVLEGEPELKAQVFYDRKNKVSVSAYQPNPPRLSRGCMVFGTSVKPNLIDHRKLPLTRSITQQEGEEVRARISPWISRLNQHGARFRYTGGFEPIRSDEPEHFRHRIETFAASSEQHNVFVAFCGRATLAEFAADDLLAATRALPRQKFKDYDKNFSSLGIPWFEPVRMHFEDSFRTLDDLEKKEPEPSND